jgi:FkbM family methyltransferase
MNILNSILFRIFGGKISYSQCGEDLILEHYFRNIGLNQITYLDIGANHPKICNNTYLFYTQGSKGVSIEPNPLLCKLLDTSRSRDRNLNFGVSAGESGIMDFYMMEPHTLSTFDSNEAESLQNDGGGKIVNTIKVDTENINEIVRLYFEKCPDLICIDVEGWNDQIVESIDFLVCKPSVFLIETISYSQNLNGVKSLKISEIMEQNGYVLFADTYLNSIYIRK